MQLKNAKSKVDNKAPFLNVDAYYKTGTMKLNAERLTQMDDENYKLVKRINVIYRTRVKTTFIQNYYKCKILNYIISSYNKLKKMFNVQIRVIYD